MRNALFTMTGTAAIAVAACVTSTIHSEMADTERRSAVTEAGVPQNVSMPRSESASIFEVAASFDRSRSDVGGLRGH